MTKGRGADGGNTGKEFISVMPTPGGSGLASKTVSKVLQIPPGLQRIGVGQRSVGGCWWAVEVRPIIVLGSVLGGVSLGAGQSLLLEGLVSDPARRCSACWVVLQELRDNLEKNKKER